MNARAATAELVWQPWLVRAAAIGSGSAVVLLILPIAWLTILGRDDSQIDDGLVFTTIGAIGILSTAGVGSFLAFRRPANAVGWLSSHSGSYWGLGGPVTSTAAMDCSPSTATCPGRSRPPRSPRTPGRGCSPCSRSSSCPLRKAVRSRAADAGSLSPRPRPDFSPAPRESPWRRPRSASSQADSPAFAFLGGAWQAAVLVSGCAACSPRHRGQRSTSCAVCAARGASSGRQLTAFAYGALLAAGEHLVLFILSAFVDIGESRGRGSCSRARSCCCPAATAVAILRYRLYAIDRIVNRTVVYGVLTALLGAAFLVLVVSLTRLFATVQDDPSPLATALATVVVTAAFLPVRARVQRAVDRRFARRRFAAVSMVEQFATRLRNDREPPERIGAVLAEALRDPGLVVAFPRLRGDGVARPLRRRREGPAGMHDDDRGARRRADRAAAARRGARRGSRRPRRGHARRPGSRSRSRGCASRCAANWRTCAPPARASSPRRTPSGGASSATSTTARSSASSRSR